MNSRLIEALCEELSVFPLDCDVAAANLAALPTGAKVAAYEAAVLAALLPGTALSPAELESLQALLKFVRSMDKSERRRSQKMFAKVRGLIDLYGEDDPHTRLAFMSAVARADPDRKHQVLVSCGVRLPAPSHQTAHGSGLTRVSVVARMLRVSQEDVLAILDKLGDIGLSLHYGPVEPRS